MDNDAFWCITLGLLILSAFWKHQRAKGVVERNRNTAKAKWDRKRSRKEEQEEKEEREKEIAEIISVIIPTIDNGQ